MRHFGSVRLLLSLRFDGFLLHLAMEMLLKILVAIQDTVATNSAVLHHRPLFRISDWIIKGVPCIWGLSMWCRVNLTLIPLVENRGLQSILHINLLLSIVYELSRALLVCLCCTRPAEAVCLVEVWSIDCIRNFELLIISLRWGAYMMLPLRSVASYLWRRVDVRAVHELLVLRHDLDMVLL